MWKTDTNLNTQGHRADFHCRDENPLYFHQPLTTLLLHQQSRQGFFSCIFHSSLGLAGCAANRDAQSRIHCSSLKPHDGLCKSGWEVGSGARTGGSLQPHSWGCGRKAVTPAGSPTCYPLLAERELS